VGALKQLAIRIEEEADATLESMGIMIDSPGYQEWHPVLVDRLQRFVEREFLDETGKSRPSWWAGSIPGRKRRNHDKAESE